MFEFTDLDLFTSISTSSSFLISLAMVTIGIAFIIGFTVKKLFQLLKSF